MEGRKENLNQLKKYYIIAIPNMKNRILKLAFALLITISAGAQKPKEVYRRDTGSDK